MLFEALPSVYYTVVHGAFVGILISRPSIAAPNEVLVNATPFVIRHAANGSVQYLDPESMPFLGYLPQDFTDKDALQLYHPDDLMYIRQQYETIVKEGGVPLSKANRYISNY